MAKNILIVPSNQVPTPNRIPFINYINSTGGDVLSLKVLLGATITFSSATQGNVFVVDPTNAVISGTTLNVKDYFSVGGVQVLNGTTNWIGPTTNIAGAQGSQGATGSQGQKGPQGDTGPQGAQGAIGPQGFIGFQGDVGSQGSVGSQGDIGSQGQKGPQGAQGATGSQGDI